MRLVITGSHPTPAQALMEQLPKDLPAQAGWTVFQLSSATGPKFKRYDWFGSLVGGVRLPGLVWQVKRKLQLIKAELVISFGGFSSVPVVLAAKLLHLPIIIHEQTFGAGLASRLTARVADRIAVSWKSSLKYFPRNKIVLTGNPVRQTILKVRRRPEKVLYFSGGSQGAQIINQTLEPLLPELTKKFMVYHQYGRLPRPAGRKNYVTKSYFSVDELAQIYSRCRLAIGRAGINTVTELAYLKIPAVLVPLPHTQKNEQAINAHYLKKLGLAVVLPQDQLTPASLLGAINQVDRLPQTRRGLGFPRSRVMNAASNLFRLCSSLSVL